MEDNELKSIVEAQQKIIKLLEEMMDVDPNRKPTFGELAADIMVGVLGSWRFMMCQSLFLGVWITMTLLGYLSFDPYPFILLNLLLSFQAAYASPLILMSQNRTEEKDRRRDIEACRNITQIKEMIRHCDHRIELCRTQSSDTTPNTESNPPHKTS